MTNKLTSYSLIALGCCFSKSKIAIYLFLVVYLLAACQSRSSLQAEKLVAKDDRNSPAASTSMYYVYKVVDGDTFWVKDAKQQQIKIRLIGIDAPETRNMFYKKKHPFGQACKEYLERLIEKRTVRLEFDVDSLDRYGRTLAYAYLPNGELINENMLRNGYAIIMTVPPNVQFVETFLKAQESARTEARGLWENYLTEDEIKF